MARRIESLSVRGFRGASKPVEISFDPASPITLIFGENGTGKSTICDAIDFVCNGRFGSLQDKSTSVRTSDAVVAIGSAPQEVEVQLAYAGLRWLAKLKGTKVDVKGPDDRPSAHILRRSDITRVVEAAPKEKYEALKLFIAVPRIEKAEKSLRDAIAATKKEVDARGQAKERADEALGALWRAAGSPGAGIDTWAREIVSQDPRELEERLKTLSAQLSTLNALGAARDQTSAARARHEQANAVHAAVTQRAQAASAGAPARQQALISLLRETQAFLGNADAPESQSVDCPVCGTPSTAAHLREHVNAQLHALAAQAALQTELEQATRQRDSAHSALLNAEESLRALESRMQDVGGTGDLDARRLALQAALDNGRRAVAERGPIQQHLQAAGDKEAPIIQAFETQLRLERMLDAVEARRKAYVDSVLRDISATVDALYARIHPKEDLGDVKFYLKPNTIGSLEFDGRFQTERSVSPASYYSEAHLDTLGLCVYLALAKHTRQGSVVVLDDVLTSIDDAHLGRVIQLLHDEAPSFNQVIVTTHFRAWRDKYRFSHAPSQQVQLIQLHRWSLERGIRHSRDQLWVDDLRAELEREPLDRQSLASKAGILMESTLDHLAQLYRCRLPRKPEGDYTLVELARGFDGKLKRALTVQRDGMALPLETGLNRIDATAWIRNQVGAHFNTQAAMVPDDEVRAFALLALDLASTLVCPQCGQMPARSRNGSDFECQCGRTHLQPLLAPG